MNDCVRSPPRVQPWLSAKGECKEHSHVLALQMNPAPYVHIPESRVGTQTRMIKVRRLEYSPAHTLTHRLRLQVRGFKLPRHFSRIGHHSPKTVGQETRRRSKSLNVNLGDRHDAIATTSPATYFPFQDKRTEADLLVFSLRRFFCSACWRRLSSSKTEFSWHDLSLASCLQSSFIANSKTPDCILYFQNPI